jgi:ABC-2 type transport system permease protein
VAVSETGRPPLSAFVRLKLRILGNGLRGSGTRITLFVLGSIAGLLGAAAGFLLFAAGGATSNPDVRLMVVVYPAALLVLSWVLMPLLFFGVDETLDPARFTLLPIRRRRLAEGMLVAACVGVPPLVTFVATLGLPFGMWFGDEPAASVVALAGVLIGLLTCVVASRAVTSAFATMLRSRRVRDLAAIIIAVLASSIAPLQLLAMAMMSNGDAGMAVRIARVLSWTPLAAPHVAPLDVAGGRWDLAVARLAIGVVTVGVLLWWWSLTLESAMIGTESAGRSGKAEAAGLSAVAGLFPRMLRRLPANQFGAIVARECRYWWREPRRRATYVSLMMASAAVPFMMTLTFDPDRPNATPLPIAVGFAGLLAGLMPANQFGNDGTAYGMHLLTGVAGKVELLARAVAVALLTVPVVTVIAVGVTLVATGDGGNLPTMLGVVIASFGAAIAVAMIVSVFGAYSMPDSSNPFAINTGGASAKGLLALLGMLAASALTAPLIAMAVLLPDTWQWLTLPTGLLWGTGGILLGSIIAGDALDHRAPEVLAAVTPRR